MKILGHIIIMITGAMFVWLFDSFINADINPFHYSGYARVGMVLCYLFYQLVGQLIYSNIIYKWE